MTLLYLVDKESGRIHVVTDSEFAGWCDAPVETEVLLNEGEWDGWYIFRTANEAKAAAVRAIWDKE